VKTKPHFGECYTRFGCETKTGVLNLLVTFQDRPLLSHITFKRSRRELSIDVAEHRSVSNNYQNTLYPRFSFIPKTGLAFPKRGFCFYCDNESMKTTNKPVAAHYSVVSSYTTRKWERVGLATVEGMYFEAGERAITYPK